MRGPVAANVHARAFHLESINEPVPGIMPGPGLPRFLYQSTSSDGDPVSASLVAANGADARTQLQPLGHTDVKILSGNREMVTLTGKFLVIVADDSPFASILFL